MVKIGIMTTLWQRHGLERIVLEYYAGLEVEGVEFCLAAAGSEGWKSETLARTNGFEYVEVPNAPLGQKHNAALQAVCALRPSIVCVIGSDDLISASYFELVRDYVLAGADAVKVNSIYYYNIQTDETTFHENVSTGAGRCIAYDVCRKRNFKAWPDDREKYLDSSMHRQIMQYTTPRLVYDQRDYDVCIIDIKGSSHNLWSAEEITEFQSIKKTHSIDTEKLFNRHFPGVLGKLRQLKKQPLEVGS